MGVAVKSIQLSFKWTVEVIQNVGQAQIIYEVGAQGQQSMIFLSFSWQC